MSRHSRATFDEGEAAGGEVQLTLDAALIYEDLRTGLRAKDVLECDARRFPRAPNINLAIWRFDVLQEAGLRETALNEASVAVIVLVSAHGRRDLPKVVSDWLQQWLKRKSKEPRALIVSLDDTSRESDSAAQMISWLQTGARAKDVAVFPQFGDTGRWEGGLAANEIQSPAYTKTAVLADVQRWPERYDDWGINE
jgi:hypothetical protein